MKIEHQSQLFFLMLSIAFLFWVFYISREGTRRQSLKNAFLRKECIGVVLEKYIDTGNHAFETFRFHDKKCNLHHYKLMDSLYNMTEINDSIRKMEGDSLLYLVKEDSVYIFNFMDMVRAAHPD